ncbi:MAG: DUF3788 domain-containing protein [Candidatus Freyarchaeum deiterrae]
MGMTIGFFLTKEQQPTMEEILTALGSKRALWEKLTQFITNNYRTREDFAFYGKNYGWAKRFRKGGKALLSLYPGKGSFTAQIILGQTETEKVSSLNLSNKVKKILEDAHQYTEGRWVFVKIESEQDINDVQQLLMVKFSPTKKRD